MIDGQLTVVLRSGWLTKQGHRFWKSWRLRWFVLTPDFLVYTIRPSAIRSRGRIDLNSISSVAPVPLRGVQGMAIFTLPGEKDFMIVGDDLPLWIGAIRSACRALATGAPLTHINPMSSAVARIGTSAAATEAPSPAKPQARGSLGGFPVLSWLAGGGSGSVSGVGSASDASTVDREDDEPTMPPSTDSSAFARELEVLSIADRAMLVGVALSGLERAVVDDTVQSPPALVEFRRRFLRVIAASQASRPEMWSQGHAAQVKRLLGIISHKQQARRPMLSPSVRPLRRRSDTAAAANARQASALRGEATSCPAPAMNGFVAQTAAKNAARERLPVAQPAGLSSSSSRSLDQGDSRAYTSAVIAGAVGSEARPAGTPIAAPGSSRRAVERSGALAAADATRSPLRPARILAGAESTSPPSGAPRQDATCVSSFGSGSPPRVGSGSTLQSMAMSAGSACDEASRCESTPVSTAAEEAQAAATAAASAAVALATTQVQAAGQPAGARRPLFPVSPGCPPPPSTPDATPGASAATTPSPHRGRPSPLRITLAGQRSVAAALTPPASGAGAATTPATGRSAPPRFRPPPIRTPDSAAGRLGGLLGAAPRASTGPAAAPSSAGTIGSARSAGRMGLSISASPAHLRLSGATASPAGSARSAGVPPLAPPRLPTRSAGPRVPLRGTMLGEGLADTDAGASGTSTDSLAGSARSARSASAGRSDALSRGASTSSASTQQQARFEDLFQLGEVLGRGAFSVVHKTRHRRSGREFAVKVLDRAAMTGDDVQSLVGEVSAQRWMRHPNIVRLVAFFDNDPTHFYLVTELCKGGELFDRVVSQARFSEKQAAGAVYILLDAVSYFHKHGIVHRDIKPENILFQDTRPDAPIKIADFGFAVHSGTGETLRSLAGSPNYLAPEIVENQPYGTAVDMWSLGVVTYILLCGYMPFDAPNQRDLFRRIAAGRFSFPDREWGGVSPEAKDFVASLLRVDPKARLTAEAALRHRWITTTDLSDVHLSRSVSKLRSFHTRRRTSMLRSAVRAVHMGRRASMALPNPSPRSSAAPASTPRRTALRHMGLTRAAADALLDDCDPPPASPAVSMAVNADPADDATRFNGIVDSPKVTADSVEPTGTAFDGPLGAPRGWRPRSVTAPDDDLLDLPGDGTAATTGSLLSGRDLRPTMARAAPTGAAPATAAATVTHPRQTRLAAAAAAPPAVVPMPPPESPPPRQH